MRDIERDPGRTPRSTARPLGSLGLALFEMQTGVQTATLVVTTLLSVLIVAILFPAIATPLGETFVYVGAVWILAVLACTVLVVAIAVIAILPPLLLPKPIGQCSPRTRGSGRGRFVAPLGGQRAQLAFRAPFP